MQQDDEATSKNRHAVMSRIVVKAWTDPAFAKRLQAQPLDVLEEEGLELEKRRDVTVIVHIDTQKTRNLVIPTAPDLLSISEEQLLMIAAQRLKIQLELF